MRLKNIIKTILFVVVFVCFAFIAYKSYRNKSDYEIRYKDTIHLATVVCGDRFSEAMVLIKSILLTSTKARVNFYVFTDQSNAKLFKDPTQFLPRDTRSDIHFIIHPVSFPTAGEWRDLFKPCSSQRIFFPSLLPDVEKLIYTDTDVVFLSPVWSLWSLFREFQIDHEAGLVVEDEDEAMSWYSRFARHPYYGTKGLNSGVMLMNLERMRKSDWERQMVENLQKYKSKIKYGDQDLINIYFHHFPRRLFNLSCNWNYRRNHCANQQNCLSAIENGIAILHGNRRVFHNSMQPAFKVIFDALSDQDVEIHNFMNEAVASLAALKGRDRCAEPLEFQLKSLPSRLSRRIRII